MKKGIIILALLIILIGGVGFGGYFVFTHPSHEYQAKDFSFRVPRGFGYESSEDDAKYTFRCLGEKVTIEDKTLNCTPEAAKGFLVYYEDEENVKTEPFEAAGMKGYFRTSDLTIRGKDLTCLAYIFGTETKFFSMDCSCSPAKALLIKKAMDNIAESVVFTSDFTLADKPDTYEFDLLSFNAGSKFTLKDETAEYSKEHTQTDLRVVIVQALADTDVGTYSPSVTVTVKKLDNSPAEFADAIYNEVQAEQDKYDSIVRDQVKLAGCDCEHIKYVKKNDTDDRTALVCHDQYFLKSGNYVYSFNAVYINSSDEALVKEILDNITIKEAKE
ncbi:MAG: hypothetical protein IKN66_14330 [Ruminococcus sp.]|nr:hypothetical protein [Ruminococcus sp.]